MALRPRRSEEYELPLRTFSDSTQASDIDSGYYTSPKRPRLSWLLAWSWIQLRPATFRAIQTRSSLPSRKRLWYCCLLYYISSSITCSTAVFIIFTALFRPSYTNLPAHYKTLQKRCSDSSKTGQGNVNNEKIFITTVLYDPRGNLIGGDWDNAVLSLVDLLGPDNAHLSIHENGADFAANTAFGNFQKKFRCKWVLTGHLS